MKYAVIVTYTTGERTGATVTASGCAAAWDKVFEMFDKADVRGVELAAILTPERRPYSSKSRRAVLRPSTTWTARSSTCSAVSGNSRRS